MDCDVHCCGLVGPYVSLFHKSKTFVCFDGMSSTYYKKDVKHLHALMGGVQHTWENMWNIYMLASLILDNLSITWPYWLDLNQLLKLGRNPHTFHFLATFYFSSNYCDNLFASSISIMELPIIVTTCLFFLYVSWSSLLYWVNNLKNILLHGWILLVM